MRRWIFALLVLVVAVTGCGRPEAPGYDDLRSQLLRDACDAIMEGDMPRARDALHRLGEAVPDDAFVPVARDWIDQQDAFESANASIADGDPGAARERLATATGTVFKALSPTLPAIDALAALRDYLQKRPFTTASAAEQALHGLDGHRAELQRSAAFVAFMEREQAGLVELRKREEHAVIECLLNELDLGAVSGQPDPSLRLAQLGILRPDHPLLKTWMAARSGDAARLSQVSEEAATNEQSRQGFEIGLCLAWNEMAEGLWLTAAQSLAREHPASLSGLLLRAAALAEMGDQAGAVQDLRTLAATITPAREHVARLLSRYLLPPHQVKAWCWSSPCPGVPEILSRIAQLRVRQSQQNR